MRILHRAFIVTFLGTLLMLAHSSAARAADRYVRADGSGINGSSWGDAWSVATLNTKWSTIAAGDTVWFAAGNYTTALMFGTGGSAGNPIRIRAAQPSDSAYVGLASFVGAGINLNGRSNILIDGSAGGQSNIKISGVNVGIWGGVNNITLGYLSIEDVGMGIELSGIGNEVHHCDIRRVNGGTSEYAAIRLSGGSNAFDVNRVHHNQIAILQGQGNNFGPDGVQPAAGCSIYNNKFTTSMHTSTLPTPEHPDYIQNAGSGAKYIKIFNNDFECGSADAAVQLGAWVSGASVQEVYVYNNLFRNLSSSSAPTEFIRMYNGSGGFASINNLKIFNNVFVDGAGPLANTSWGCASDFTTGGNYCPISFTRLGTPTGNGVEFRNNIFYNTGNGANSPAIHIRSNLAASFFKFSNNIYYNPGGSSQNYIRIGDPALKAEYDSFKGVTIAAWLAQETTGSSAQPTFKSYLQYSDSNNYELASTDVAARDRGAALGAPFDVDHLGVSRPQGGAWDIGAYEYLTGVVPNSPTNLRVQ